MNFKNLISIIENNKYLFLAIFFFIVVNTSYFWNPKIGIFSIPFFILLIVIFILFLFYFLIQIAFILKEKFSDINRILKTILLLFILITIFIYPSGIIDFEKFESDALLIANREGAANCTTTLKLKKNNIFKEKNICFAITEITGQYHIKNDTIYFSNVKLGRDVDDYYAFAVIKKTTCTNKKIIADLVRYKNINDSIGHTLWITKNELLP